MKAWNWAEENTHIRSHHYLCAPIDFTLRGKTAITHWTSDWMDCETRLDDVVENKFNSSGIEPWPSSQRQGHCSVSAVPTYIKPVLVK
jgi:hypothetical protein